MIRLNGVRFEDMTLTQKLLSLAVVAAFIGLVILALPFLLGLLGIILFVVLCAAGWTMWKAKKFQAQVEEQLQKQFEAQQARNYEAQSGMAPESEMSGMRRHNQQDFRQRTRPDYDDTVIDVTER